MTREEIIKEKDIVVRQLSQYVPQLRPFLDLDINLKEYAKKLYTFTISANHLKRQELIKRKINDKLTKLFGKNFKNELKINLDEKLAVNIADHHQVLNHPFIMSSNVISSINKFLQNEKPEAILTISCADVPPNNYFSKAGFQFHGKRVPIFSTSEREHISHYLPKRDFNFVEKLKVIGRWHEFDKSEQKFLQNEFTSLQSFDFSKCENYSDQITIIIKNTWPRLFENTLQPNLPELIYLTQEELVTDCLIELLTEDNLISQSLFNKEFREKIIENFRGIVITWNEAEQKGTHFFWRKYPGQPRALRMYIEGDKLVPTDERFKHLTVPLERDSIIELLKKKEIFPGLFLIFSVLNFYAGIKPLVGYGSLIYLDFMKQAWLKTLADSDFKDEATDLQMVSTDGFVAGLATFFKRIEGKAQTLFAHDIFYEGGITKKYLEKLFEISFKDLFSVAVVDMHDYYAAKYIPPSEKIKPKVNFDDLANIIFDWI